MSQKQIICTILAKNYVSFARTLMQSVRQHNPDIVCYALIIDDWHGFIDPKTEPFEVVSLSDLTIENERSMAFKYDITEFSTAVKPFFLAYLLEKKQADKILYLDPDILVTGSLGELFDRLNQADFLVTPHLDMDYPEDGLQPDEQHILLAGMYNLGFFGIKRTPNALRFLEWWQNKLQTRCVISPSQGYFVDQRFIDLASTAFPGFHIERGAGYNVAYWNLHSRQLTGEGSARRCNGSPLSFFHFSGYNPEEPKRLSKYNTRIILDQRADLQPIFAYYGSELLRNGYRETIRWPYSNATFADGAPVTYFTRVRYREVLARGAGVADPFQMNRQERKALTKEGLIRNSKFYTRIANAAHALLPPFLWTIRSRGRRSFRGVKLADNDLLGTAKTNDS